MKSVRRRLLVLLTVGFAVLIVGAAVAFAAVARGGVVDEFDAGLSTRARTIEALTESEKGRIELDYTPTTMPEFEREDRPDYFQIWLDDGPSLYRTRRLTVDLPRSVSPSGTPRRVMAALSSPFRATTCRC